jgi:hypothetical protein
MQAHNSRTARLGLESLEGRIVLSTTTLPAAAPIIGRQSATPPMQVDHLSARTASVAPQAAKTQASASFSYGWVAGPRSVLVGTNTKTGNGKSSGSVALALVRNRSASAHVGGPPVTLRVGFITTTGSATPRDPDRYHVAFSMKLHLRDAASGRSADVIFRGTINGTLSWKGSHLKATFQTPTTQRVILGNHVYTVTLPRSFTPAGPYEAPVSLYARIQVSARR